jgi:gluconolactonase
MLPGKGKNLPGGGTMVSILSWSPMRKSEEVPHVDRFVFVVEGTIDQLIDGSPVTMISGKREEPDGVHSATPRIDFVFLEKGSKNALTAGPSGAKLIEISSPIRLDYLQKAGVENVPVKSVDLKAPQVPNVQPNKVYDLYDFQFTQLAPGSNSRLVTGRNTQISLFLWTPGSV